MSNEIYSTAAKLGAYSAELPYDQAVPVHQMTWLVATGRIPPDRAEYLVGITTTDYPGSLPYDRWRVANAESSPGVLDRIRLQEAYPQLAEEAAESQAHGRPLGDGRRDVAAYLLTDSTDEPVVLKVPELTGERTDQTRTGGRRVGVSERRLSVLLLDRPVHGYEQAVALDYASGNIGTTYMEGQTLGLVPVEIVAAMPPEHLKGMLETVDGGSAQRLIFDFIDFGNTHYNRELGLLVFDALKRNRVGDQENVVATNYTGLLSELYNLSGNLPGQAGSREGAMAADALVRRLIALRPALEAYVPAARKRLRSLNQRRSQALDALSRPL